MSVFTLAISFDHFQFALIHGPNIPSSYAILLFTALALLPSPVILTTGCCFCFGSVSPFFLELFLQWSPVAYWATIDLGSSSFRVYLFPFHTVHGVLKARILQYYLFARVVCHSLSSGPCFASTLHHDLAVLGGPTQHGSLFHWVRQGYGPCDQFD